MKVTIVGAGAVGGSCADNIIRKNICDELIILDIKKDIAIGKALDLRQTASLLDLNTKIIGCSDSDYSCTSDTNVAIITSGLPRKPGMNRESLLEFNSKIVKTVVNNILQYSPNVIFLIISNPIDSMTYLVLKHTKLLKNRVIGMGGVLDSCRFKSYISSMIGVPSSDLQANVIGGHGDNTMIPLARLATYQNIPISNFLDKKTIEKIITNTMKGGAILTNLLGTSAWSAPGAAAMIIVESILKDKKKILPCSVYLEGEYNQFDICLGVPVIVSKNGWDKILNLDLNKEEKLLFSNSSNSVRKINNLLYKK